MGYAENPGGYSGRMPTQTYDPKPKCFFLLPATLDDTRASHELLPSIKNLEKILGTAGIKLYDNR